MTQILQAKNELVEAENTVYGEVINFAKENFEQIGEEMRVIQRDRCKRKSAVNSQ